MFCPKCGNDAGDAKFCPGCGAELGDGTSGFANATSDSAPNVNGNSTPNQTSMAENTAGLLTYVLGWVTGIIFMIVDKRPFVKFHAMQSILVFGSLTVLNIVLSTLTSILPFGLWFITSFINKLLSLTGFILWVLLIVKAYQGNRYKLPYFGDLAEKMSDNVKL